MIMGVFESNPLINMNLVQEGERMIYTSQAYIKELTVSLARMSQGSALFDNLITARISLDRIVEDGFEELLRNPNKHTKIAVRVSDSE